MNCTIMLLSSMGNPSCIPFGSSAKQYVNNKMKIQYKPIGQKVVERLVKPQGVIFAEYYFYLISHIHDKEFDSPTPYRLDRIASYEITKEKIHLPL